MEVIWKWWNNDHEQNSDGFETVQRNGSQNDQCFDEWYHGRNISQYIFSYSYKDTSIQAMDLRPKIFQNINFTQHYKDIKFIKRIVSCIRYFVHPSWNKSENYYCPLENYNTSGEQLSKFDEQHSYYITLSQNILFTIASRLNPSLESTSASRRHLFRVFFHLFYKRWRYNLWTYLETRYVSNPSLISMIKILDAVNENNDSPLLENARGLKCPTKCTGSIENTSVDLLGIKPDTGMLFLLPFTPSPLYNT